MSARCGQQSRLGVNWTVAVALAGALVLACDDASSLLTQGDVAGAVRDLGMLPTGGGGPGGAGAGGATLDPDTGAGGALDPDAGAGGAGGVIAPDLGAGGVLAPDLGAGGAVLAPDVGVGGAVLDPDAGAGGAVLGPDAGMAGPCAPDALEPNDDRPTAAPLQVGLAEDLSICADDIDYFSIDVCAGGTLTVDVLFTHAEGDLDAALEDAAEDVVAISDSVDDNERLQHRSEVAQTMRLVVAGFEGAANGYQVQVNIEGCAPECAGAADCGEGMVCVDGFCVRDQPGCQDDNLEENDDIAGASPIEPGVRPGLVICPGDEDLYAIELCAGGTLAVDVRFSHAGGDLDVALLSADGARLALSESVTDDERIDFDSAADQAVYLQVFGFNDSSNGYELAIEIAGCQDPICVDDDLEPNDAVDVAAPIVAPARQAATLCPGNDDYYVVRVCGGGRLAVVASFTHADGDVDLILSDPAGVEVARALSADDDERAEVAGAEAGLYSIRVFGATPDVQNDYGLTVEVLDCGCQVDGDCAPGEICAGGICEAPPPCVDDLLEENDDRAGAVPLGGAENGLQICSGDEDWFAVDLCAGGTLTATARFRHADGDLDVELLSEAGDRLGRSISTSDDEQVGFQAQADATLYLRIYGFAGAQNGYDLELAIAGCADPVCADDPLEENDDRGTAAPLVPPEDLADLAICPGDDDWYAIDVCAGGALTVSAAFLHAQGDLDLQLTDDNGALLAASGSITDDERLRWEAPLDATVYLRVLGFGGAQNRYGLGVELAGCDCVDDRDCGQDQQCQNGACVPRPFCVDDDLEENDDPAAAAPLAPGDHLGLAICAQDDDWYAVDVCGGGTLTLDVRFLHASGDLDASLADAAGNRLAAAGSATDDEQIVWQAGPADATVFLRVFGFQGAENDYDLGVALAGCAAPVCVDDDLEPNDALDAAGPLAPDLYPGLAICTGNDDWYAIDVCAGGTLTAQAIFSHAQGDIDMRLQDAAGDRLGSSTSVTDDESIRFDAQADATVYLRVWGFAGAENDYDLAIDLAGCGCLADADCAPGQRCDAGACLDVPVCLDDNLEPNDDVAGAAPLAPGDYPGQVICPNDADVFAVDLCDGGTLAVNLAFAHASGDLDLEILDPGGRPLVFSNSATDDEQAAYQNASGGALTLYVRVYGFAGAENGYDLNVAVDCPVPPCVDDGFEPNDNLQAATGVAPGIFPDLAICGDDDWYAIDTCPGGVLTARARFVDAAGDLDIALHDAAGNRLIRSTSTTDDEALRWDVQAAGPLFLRVYGYRGAENGYDLELELAGCAPAALACPADDPMEPNDDPGTATPLLPAQAVEGITCGDDDWFAFDADLGCTLTADLTFVDASGDLDLVMQDSNGNILDRSESTSDNESIRLDVPAMGTYTYRVHGFLGAENTYRFVVNMACP